MRKFAILTTILAAGAAFAPLAAHADVGTSMYQPNPIIVHAPDHRSTVTHPRKVAFGRSAYDQQIKAIRTARAVG